MARREVSLMFGGRPGIWEIVIILVIILIIFGAGKLPQVGGAIGRGIRNFRRGQTGEDDEEEETEEVAEPPKKTTRKKTAKR
jgi:sec-independent protein translocase protein TatA